MRFAIVRHPALALAVAAALVLCTTRAAIAAPPAPAELPPLPAGEFVELGIEGDLLQLAQSSAPSPPRLQVADTVVVDESDAFGQVGGVFQIIPTAPGFELSAVLSFVRRPALAGHRDLWLELTAFGIAAQPEALSPLGLQAGELLLTPEVAPVFQAHYGAAGQEAFFEFEQTGASLCAGLLERLLAALARRAGVAPPSDANLLGKIDDFKALNAFGAAGDELAPAATNRSQLRAAFGRASRALRALATDPAQRTAFTGLVNDCLGTALSEAQVARFTRLSNTPSLYGSLSTHARRFLNDTNGGDPVIVRFRAEDSQQQEGAPRPGLDLGR